MLECHTFTSSWEPNINVRSFECEQPTKGGALPKFGDWDVKDPDAGEGFTVIFQKLADEKKEGGPVQIPRLNPDHRLSHDEGHGKRSQYGASKVTKDTKHSRQPGCCTIL